MIRVQHLLSVLRAQLESLLKIELAVPEPGFIGPIPYLLLLRWLILGGIWLRFVVHAEQYVGRYQWPLILVSIGVTAILTLIATYVTTQPTLRRSKRIQGLFVASDVLLISI